MNTKPVIITLVLALVVLTGVVFRQNMVINIQRQVILSLFRDYVQLSHDCGSPQQ